jgi:phosphatidylglycerol lysyltransferase
MNLQSARTGLLALVVLGSGIVNLFSVVGPALPERAAILHEIFPLVFIHLSRFFTLLTGFALVILSINIYKRKKRAFQLTLVLSI